MHRNGHIFNRTRISDRDNKAFRRNVPNLIQMRRFVVNKKGIKKPQKQNKLYRSSSSLIGMFPWSSKQYVAQIISPFSNTRTGSHVVIYIPAPALRWPLIRKYPYAFSFQKAASQSFDQLERMKLTRFRTKNQYVWHKLMELRQLGLNSAPCVRVGPTQLTFLLKNIRWKLRRN